MAADPPVVLGEIKQGEDKTFRSIVFAVAGVPQDLTAEGWSVASQLRPTVGAPEKVDLAVDAALLPSSIISLSLTRAQSLALRDGTYLCDVQVTGPAPVGRRKSKTMHLVVLADVTRTEP